MLELDSEFLSGVRRRTRPQIYTGAVEAVGSASSVDGGESSSVSSRNDHTAPPKLQKISGEVQNEYGEGGGRQMQPGSATQRHPTPKPRHGSGDYEVGYGKPPKSGQFQKGRSGNGKGRPKASRNVRTIVTEAIFKMREVTLDGKKLRMPQFEVGLQQMMNRFMTGDPRAAATLIGLLAKINELGGQPAAEGQHSTAVAPLSNSNKRMLARFHSDLFRDAGVPEGLIGALLHGMGLSEPEEEGGLDRGAASGEGSSADNRHDDSADHIEDDEDNHGDGNGEREEGNDDFIV